MLPTSYFIVWADAFLQVPKSINLIRHQITPVIFYMICCACLRNENDIFFLANYQMCGQWWLFRVLGHSIKICGKIDKSFSKPPTNAFFHSLNCQTAIFGQVMPAIGAFMGESRLVMRSLCIYIPLWRKFNTKCISVIKTIRLRNT